ncbi:MAG: SDR family NAD(P)-dependent oxidoreductase [Burkholderiaceae bacterium]
MASLHPFHPPRPLAVVTGASSGIGRELAQLAAQDGHDLVIAADQGPLEETAVALRAFGADVETVEADLSTSFGIDKLMLSIGGRPVDLLVANAGHGLGHGFLDKPFAEARHVIDTNVTGTLDLLHRVATGMRQRDSGRILITGSIAGLMPGSFQAVYNGTKAFIDSFSFALRNELQDTAVTVTCLMPGATDTGFFERADMLDTKVGSEAKSAPADVARQGYEAIKKGQDKVVAGWKNKLSAAMTNLTPDGMLAKQHRKMAEPGSARQ